MQRQYTTKNKKHIEQLHKLYDDCHYETDGIRTAFNCELSSISYFTKKQSGIGRGELLATISVRNYTNTDCTEYTVIIY